MLLTPLTAEQRRELLVLKNAKSTHPKARERVEMVLLADAGWENARIATHLGKGESTVQQIVRNFVKQGMASFEIGYFGPRGGYKADSDFITRLEKKLEEERIWTAPQLQAELEKETGTRVCLDWIRKLCKARGYAWKRTKRSVAHSRKPEVFEARREALDVLKKR
jgi:transposase